MEVFREAGLPDGVINLVFVSGAVAGDVFLVIVTLPGFTLPVEQTHSTRFTEKLPVI
jgi:hypothetical protein